MPSTVIDLPTTWTAADFLPHGNVFVNGSVTIEPGGSLTIGNGVNARFPENGKINVKVGGNFDLQGSLNALCCSYWQGVEVQGTAGAIQSPQTHGFFSGSAGALIENAKTGVWSKNGGIVQANGMTFRNNGFGIYLSPYTLHDDGSTYASSVSDSYFHTNYSNRTTFGNDPLINLFKSHMLVLGYKSYNGQSVLIDNCRMENGYGFSQYPTRFGIFTQNSDIRVRGDNNDNTEEFRDLEYGIAALNNYTTGFVSLFGAAFSRCSFGYYGSSTPSYLAGNLFNLGNSWFNPNLSQFPDPALQPPPDQFGIFLSDATPVFTIQGNRFLQSVQTGSIPEHTVGSYIKGTGAFNNFLSLNVYDGLDYGNIADDLNASGGTMGATGLHYICNWNTSDQRFDFAVTLDGSIRSEQGSFNFGTGLFDAAGNTFSYSGTSSDASDFNNLGPSANYYYYDDPLSNQEPVDYFNLQLIERDGPSGCLRRYEPLNSLVSGELEQYKSDYFLSKVMYDTAAGDWQDALGSLDTAEATQQYLSMSGYREIMDFSIGNIVFEILANSHNRDSLRLWLSRYDRLEAEYFIAREYLAENRHSAADSVLQLAVAKYPPDNIGLVELNAVRTITSLLAGKDVYDLDTLTLDSLQVFADDSYGHATAWARALRTPYGYWYPVEYTLPEGVEERRGQHESKESGAANLKELQEYRLLPNPASGRALLILPSEASNDLTFDMYDMLGRNVRSVRVQVRDNRSIDLIGLANGGHVWKLCDAQGVLATGRLLVQNH
ncbi:MAG: hypothetical protein ACKVU2_08395 [Saprospiraceae bacterium]